MAESKKGVREAADGAEGEEEPAKPEPIFKAEAYMEGEAEYVDAIDTVRLTSQHKKIIMETWEDMSEHMDTHGPRIFIRIFEVSPKIQTVFKLDNVSPAELRGHPTLVRHSRQFMEAIEYAVMNMDKIEGSPDGNEVAKVFINLGKHHIRFKGLKDQHFGVFTGSIIYVLSDSLGEKFNKDARSAWSRLLDYLIQNIQLGWQQEVKAKGGRRD